MRITSFSGVLPKVAPVDLPFQNAVIAENAEFYGVELRPMRAPRRGQRMLTQTGGTVNFIPKTIYVSDGTTVAFPEVTSVAPDPQNRSGPDGFLFVQNGKLYRSSGRAIRMGENPIEVGIPPPTDAPTGAVLEGRGCGYRFPELLCVPDRGPDCAEDAVPPVATTYVYTFVSNCNEESAPSPPSEVIDRYPDDSVMLSHGGSIPPNTASIRWYRSIAASDGTAEFLFLGQGAAGGMFEDNYCAFELGDILTTERHAPPPTCLDGVAIVGNGVTMVWGGTQIWLSEPFLPHAFPPEWQLEIPYPIVNAMGLTEFIEGRETFWVAAVTTGKPFMFKGRLPEMVEVSEVQAWLPALSKRAFVEAEGVIYYAAADGVVAFTSSSIEVITQESHTEYEWLNEYPEDMVFGYNKGQLYGFAQRPIAKGFALPVSRVLKSRPNTFSNITLPVSAVHSMAERGMAVSLMTSENDDSSMFDWGESGEYLGYRWRSKPVLQSGRWHPTSMKVVANFPRLSGAAARAKQAYQSWSTRFKRYGDVRGFVAAFPEFKIYAPTLVGPTAEITVKVFCDDVEIYSRVVGHSEPFRLPRVRKGLEWYVEVSGKMPIREVHMQTSHDDLTAEGGHA